MAHRLVVVDHSFVEPSYRRRWEILAERYPVEVTLLTPKKWELRTSGGLELVCPDPIDRENFELRPLPTTSKSDWMKYLFCSIDAELRDIRPDVIHLQHSEMTLVNHQFLIFRRLWARDAHITFFTMNALGVPRDSWHHRIRWRHLKDNVEAALCHYPGCLESLRNGGFEKPIYIQTSYGVNEDMFEPSQHVRSNVRSEIGFEDTFVIGYAGRLTANKGIDDLLAAMPLDDIDWSLLLIGEGDMLETIEEEVRENGWEDRVCLPGYVPKREVAKYMNAMDCFFLGSKTKDYWVDTFPRSIVEAMACGVPIVGSDSGAIPFQVGEAGFIYPEGDVQALVRKLINLANDKSLRKQLGTRGRNESVSRFGQEVLADDFYKILQQVHSGKIEYNQKNEAVRHKAY